MGDAAKPITVAALCGSLRKGSFNRMALNAAIEMAPAGMTIQPVDIGAVPPFNDDVRLAGYPEPVQALRARIAAADALLFATPEYNYSVPGVLKNAIDWASRPPEQPFNGKPVAIMGASGGNSGTMRAQYHLRQICVFVNALPLNKPEVFITQAASKFDAAGKLTDQPASDAIKDLLIALAAWTRRLRAG